MLDYSFPHCEVHNIAGAKTAESHVFAYLFRSTFSWSLFPHTSSHIEVRDAINLASTSGNMTDLLTVSLPDRQRQLNQTQLVAKSAEASVILSVVLCGITTGTLISHFSLAETDLSSSVAIIQHCTPDTCVIASSPCCKKQSLAR